MEKTPVIEHDTCARCRWYDAVRADMSICRLRPPTGTGALVQGISGKPGWVYTALWPVVTSQDWCGEFSPKLSS